MAAGTNTDRPKLLHMKHLHIWQPTCVQAQRMKWAWMMMMITLASAGGYGQEQAAGQPGRRQDSVATFRSSVDLVRVSAVVRNKKGRFVQDLTARDFEILDGGQQRTITDCQRDVAGVSIAL